MPPQKLLNPPLVVISLGRLGSSMDGVPVPPGHPRAAELKYTVPVRPRRGLSGVQVCPGCAGCRAPPGGHFFFNRPGSLAEVG